jgi:hypothetical protein
MVERNLKSRLTPILQKCNEWLSLVYRTGKHGIMVKRCIGIDVGRSHLRAVQMARTPEGFFLEKTFGMPARRSTDSLAEILRSLAGEHGFDRHADIAISMPAHAVSFAEIETDEAGWKAVQAGDTLVLRDDLPIPAEDAIIQICSARPLPNGKYSVLVAATTSELLGEQLLLFDEDRTGPVAADAPIMAIHACVALNHPEATVGIALLLSVDESILTLAVTQDANILIVRNIPVPCDQDAQAPVEQVIEIVQREVEITWRKLFDADPEKDLCVFLVSAPKAAGPLAAALQAKMACRVVVADPYVRVKHADRQTETDFPLCLAEGLALRALTAEQEDRSNFLAAYNTRMRPHRAIRKELIACAALLAAIAVIWFVGLFVQLSALESEYARLTEQIDIVFHQALPQEKNVVNPLVQLQQKLDDFQRDSELFSSFKPGRSSPLAIMHMLTTHTPTQGNPRLYDLLITPDSVQAMGTCDSFAVLTEWQQLLKQIPSFDTVKVQDQKRDARTGQVHFTLAMSSAKAGQ